MFSLHAMKLYDYKPNKNILFPLFSILRTLYRPFFKLSHKMVPCMLKSSFVCIYINTRESSVCNISISYTKCCKNPFLKSYRNGNYADIRMTNTSPQFFIGSLNLFITFASLQMSFTLFNSKASAEVLMSSEV